MLKIDSTAVIPERIFLNIGALGGTPSTATITVKGRITLVWCTVSI